MNFGYVAVETFIATEEYKKWSRLSHVERIISLDCSLCPAILNEPLEDEFIYDNRNSWYYDISNNMDILLKRVKNNSEIQILAVIKNPNSECKDECKDNRFVFRGYDLIEDGTRISALSNCGGFDKAFLPSDISKFGLLDNYEKAKEIQMRLLNEYPDEAHADCIIWAIWIMKSEDEL